MLRHVFQKARQRKTRPSLPQRIVSDAFDSAVMPGHVTLFALASLDKDDNTYRITFSKKYTASYHHKSGPQGLSLAQTIDEMDCWQQTQMAQGSKKHDAVNLGFEAEHYRAVAHKFGFPIGPGGRSLAHAGRVKQLLRMRLRVPRPRVQRKSRR